MIENETSKLEGTLGNLNEYMDSVADREDNKSLTKKIRDASEKTKELEKESDELYKELAEIKAPDDLDEERAEKKE